MSSHIPKGREDAHCQSHLEIVKEASSGAFLSLFYSAHLGSCTKVTENQFKHYSLVNILLCKRGKHTNKIVLKLDV